MTPPGSHHTVLPKRVLIGRHDTSVIRVSPIVQEAATLEAAAVFALLSTRATGLTSEQPTARVAEHGPNVLPHDERPGLARLLIRALLNPLVILLAVLATVSIATGDPRAAMMMALMIMLSVGLKLFQEAKAGSIAAKLKAMISVHATVLRDCQTREIPISQLVPGDVVQLAAGDMIPGDVRIVQAKDLCVIQGALTGESLPVESRASWPVIATGLAIIAVGIALPFSFVGRYLGFTALPSLYWPILAATVACYLVLTQGVKTWLVRGGKKRNGL